MGIKEEIYVPLMNEGTQVWRPTMGEKLGHLIYRVMPINGYIPADEEWKFLPGTVVVCKESMRWGKKALIAVDYYDI